jgi:hypothetical protein
LLWNYAERSIPISYFHLVNSFELTHQFRTFCNSKPKLFSKMGKVTEGFSSEFISIFLFNYL